MFLDELLGHKGGGGGGGMGAVEFEAMRTRMEADFQGKLAALNKEIEQLRTLLMDRPAAPVEVSRTLLERTGKTREVHALCRMCAGAAVVCLGGQRW